MRFVSGLEGVKHEILRIKLQLYRDVCIGEIKTFSVMITHILIKLQLYRDVCIGEIKKFSIMITHILTQLLHLLTPFKNEILDVTSPTDPDLAPSGLSCA
ncbi:hypothetical protein BsWGS_27378 [Bradybaena similaris]